jgi:hypothetical protein
MAMMTDHWQVIEDELQRSRDALAFACLSHNFTPPAIKVRCDKMDAALAFVREQRQLAAHPDAWEPIDYLINDSLVELYADEMAITIGWDDTAHATMAWPEEGMYAVCRRKQEGK